MTGCHQTRGTQSGGSPSRVGGKEMAEIAQSKTGSGRAVQPGKSSTKNAKKKTKQSNGKGLVSKAFDFAFFGAVVVIMLTVSLLWLPRWEALVTATVIFVISAGMIVFVSFSSSQQQLIRKAPYEQINYKIFSPFALVFSFVAICYLLNLVQPNLFVGSRNASIIDFSVFAFDNILRVIFWDVPEIYGLSATSITHNMEYLWISTLIFLFRALIGLSLIKMVIVLLRN